MTHWRTCIEKDHLGAWDLVGPDGSTPRDYTLRIVAWTSKLLKTKGDPKGKRKLVLTFEGARKRFVCNATNAETIESLYGKHLEDWVGKSVTLYQSDVRNPGGSGTIKGIKVRPKVPAGKAESIAERPVDQDMRAQQNEAFGREPGED